MRQRDIVRLKLDTEQISARIQDRIEARKSQDWELADGIRAELAGQRIALMDSPEGTTWKVMRDTGEQGI